MEDTPATSSSTEDARSHEGVAQRRERDGSGRGGKAALVMVGLALLATLLACGVFALVSVPFGDVLATGDAVALIHLEGAIVGGSDPLAATPETIIGQLRAAEEDPSVKAILLRIDSPGGTVAASQEIAMAVERVEKPVVASIGDVGASGAYMVASQCDLILAAPTSSVGSIGVIMEVPDLQGLMDKLGVEVVTLTKGELKDAGSPFKDLTDRERELIDEQMSIAYDQFVEIVADGREMEVAEVRELATGWAWMGVEAQRMGLVDELGNYSDGVDAAAELGGIEGTPEVVSYDETTLSDVVGRLLFMSSRLADIHAAEELSRRSVVPR